MSADGAAVALATRRTPSASTTSTAIRSAAAGTTRPATSRSAASGSGEAPSIAPARARSAALASARAVRSRCHDPQTATTPVAAIAAHRTR